MLDLTNLNQDQLNKLCGDGEELPEYLARIALDIPAPKYLPLPKTPEECATWLAHIPAGIHRNEVEMVLSVWSMLSHQEIEKAETFEAIQTAYEKAPEGTDVKREAIVKWDRMSFLAIARAKTLEQAREAYRRTPLGSVRRFEAIRKMAEIILKEET